MSKNARSGHETTLLIGGEWLHKGDDGRHEATNNNVISNVMRQNWFFLSPFGAVSSLQWISTMYSTVFRRNWYLILKGESGGFVTY